MCSLQPACGPFYATTSRVVLVLTVSDGARSAAQVILAIDPLFSILLGLAVDKSETKLGPLGWTGGGILIFACLVASRYARAH